MDEGFASKFTEKISVPIFTMMNSYCLPNRTLQSLGTR